MKKWLTEKEHLRMQTNKKRPVRQVFAACRQSLQAFLYNKGNNTILWGMNMLSKREEERRNQLEVVAL
ncbi:hypothetical protein ACQCU3_17360, partial [Bacillus altitudinis]|uniref:hypothetical protein n=1 Tax=Bacillus altitudinis TaxID=293387 RepID=UPI003CED0C71